VIRQPQQMRQAEPRIIAPPPNSAMVGSVPDPFAQPQRMPLHQVSSVPQPSPQMIAVARPSVSFSGQPVPQSQVYTGIPMSQAPLPRPQSVFPAQPGIPDQNFIGQQPGVNIVRPVGGAAIQPIYRNMEPLAQQQQQQSSNQPSFLIPRPGPVQQPVFIQRLPASDRPPFDGGVVRIPMSLQSSLPGYVDFGSGDGNQIRFKSGFSSDPEIVGQPIETVIRDREGQARPIDSRGTVSFGQNKAKQLFGAK